ncbi:MAG: HEAT repeat domain-containing protein [Thermodesulfobacteriota bacterium]|nr:HEAT repeat domain-containing protein [Thermodesulfobacteriota bacterium]
MLKRRISILIIIVSGLILAQVLSTVFVYLSNINLYHTMEILKNEGYLIVPNEHIMDHLHGFTPAFWGGLFFTLTLGSGLTLLSLLMGLIWMRLSKRKKIPIVILCFIQALCVLEVNRNGLSIVASLFFIIVPIGVFIIATQLLARNTGIKNKIYPLIHIIPLLILSVLWLSQASKDIFVDIRDNLLLSNSVGMNINSFYYEYTLYPAEAYKTLRQKRIKTCNLEEVGNPDVKKRLKRILVNFDYMEIKNNEYVDLQIIQQGGELILQNTGKTILSTSAEEFFENSGNILDSFSMMCDRYGFLRQAVYVSLLFGFPLLLYILIHISMSSVLSLLMNESISSYIVSVCGLIVGILMLLPIYRANNIELDINNLSTMLQSENKLERIASLKFIVRNRLEITEYKAYKKTMKSSYVPETYWTVRALGSSRSPQVFDDLVGFLNSPHDNVVCMAYHALGKRGDRKAVDVILKRIKMSNHWYRQWYAYRALRNLGWKQKASN